MRPLDPKKIRWIVVHTADSAGDVSAAEIRRWHTEERGWSDIGYHYVVRYDGTIEPGRPISLQGAHVYGINHESLGICFTGNGDLHEWTPRQREAGLALIQKLLLKYDLPLSAVIGHREINDLVDEGEVPSVWAGKSLKTPKSCPGAKIDMDAVRGAVPKVPTPQARVIQ